MCGSWKDLYFKVIGIMRGRRGVLKSKSFSKKSRMLNWKVEDSNQNTFHGRVWIFSVTQIEPSNLDKFSKVFQKVFQRKAGCWTWKVEDSNQNTFHGRGMDIFCNTIEPSNLDKSQIGCLCTLKWAIWSGRRINNSHANLVSTYWVIIIRKLVTVKLRDLKCSHEEHLNLLTILSTY